MMVWPRCEWCGSPADVIDNYDTLRCWECWDGGGRDRPHNLVIRMLHNREECDQTVAACGGCKIAGGRLAHGALDFGGSA